MKVGSVVVTPLPQADGSHKNRPALVIASVRPFGDLRVCGISTQFRRAVRDFDEIVDPAEEDYAASGLHAPSVIRLGYVSTVPFSNVKGRIGSVSVTRHARLVRRLAAYLAEAANT